MARLTVKDRNLLRFPPTETTWVCNARMGDGKCLVVNAGRNTQCVQCAAAKPSRPKLLWPTYLAACKKAGHEPGTAWRYAPPATTTAKPKPTRRKT